VSVDDFNGGEVPMPDEPSHLGCRQRGRSHYGHRGQCTTRGGAREASSGLFTGALSPAQQSRAGDTPAAGPLTLSDYLATPRGLTAAASLGPQARPGRATPKRVRTGSAGSRRASRTGLLDRPDASTKRAPRVQVRLGASRDLDGRARLANPAQTEVSAYVPPPIQTKPHRTMQERPRHDARSFTN